MTENEARIRKMVVRGIIEEFFEEMGRVKIGGEFDRGIFEYLMEQLERKEQKELFEKPYVIEFLKEHGLRYELAAAKSKPVGAQWDSKSMSLGGKKKKLKFL